MNTNIKPKKKRDECDHDKSMETIVEEDEAENKQANMVLVDEKKIFDLVWYRSVFGNANFFRIFRSFYRLANIPEDAQNNPFAMFLDKNSLSRSFADVFGVENNELASRLACMLQESLDLPRLRKIDILRFYHILSELFEERD